METAAVQFRTAISHPRDSSELAGPVFKEEVQVQKAIGFIACVSVMAMSLYLFSGGDPSRILSAQTEPEEKDSYGSVARRFLEDARQEAQQGDLQEARRLAETAASLSANWEPGEQTPQQFIDELAGADKSAPIRLMRIHLTMPNGRHSAMTRAKLPTATRLLSMARLRHLRQRMQHRKTPVSPN